MLEWDILGVTAFLHLVVSWGRGLGEWGGTGWNRGSRRQRLPPSGSAKKELKEIARPSMAPNNGYGTRARGRQKSGTIWWVEGITQCGRGECHGGKQ